MDYRGQVAHHEAPHAVIALMTRLGLSQDGMDIDAPTSVPGAFGKTGVMTHGAELEQPESDQFNDLGRLLAVTLAGAVSDAKLKGLSPSDALQAQPGDLAVAKRFCTEYPFAQDEGEAVALDRGLQIAAKRLAEPGAWDAVCAVAKACLARGGKLSKLEIEDIALPILGIEGPVGLVATPD
ncbi:MAG: hypothetical protein WDN02_03040 [Methylovirgula sp.]|uniref:hypothetical protein n=1 Tax=Methylovirgula sp. TaxID=1978224 RepID=UPI003076848D